MSVSNQHILKAWVMPTLLGLILAAAFTLPTVSLAHQEIPPPLPPPPDEPPPPCKTKVTTETFTDAEGCEKTRQRIECVASGTPNTVSYRNGYESFIRDDLVINGVYPIEMKRQYMSNSTYDSPLGYGWSFNHDLRLFEYPDGSVIVRTGCGVNYKFIYTANAYQAEIGTQVLKKNVADNSFDLYYLSGTQDHFDSQGRLTEAWDVKGNRLEYSYNAEKMPLIGSSPYGVDKSRPITVAYVYQMSQIRERLASNALSGNEVNFTYSPATGRLQSIISNDGRAITYEYDDAGNNLTKGNLVKVNGLENVTSTYKYEDVVDINAVPLVYKDHHNVTEIKHTENSEAIVLQYDVYNDRVIKETVGYSEYVFDWAAYPLSTKVTEKVTDDMGLNPVYSIRKYTFDANAYLSEFKDAFGHRTTYTNDANGNSTKVVFEENQGTYASPVYSEVRTVDATYSTGGDKLTEEITLDTGELVSYTRSYDDVRLTVKTISSSLAGSNTVKTENIYNHGSDGKPTTLQASRRYLNDGVSFLETSYTYDANGNIFTATLPDGHVIVNEYGSAYSGRYVTKTYHQIGGLAVAELEERYEYDDMGNRIKITDARGYDTVTTYDDKNRRVSLTNAKGHLTTFVYDINDNLVQISRDRSAVADQLDITKLTYNADNRLIQIDRTDSGGFFIKRSSMRYDSAGNVIAQGDANGSETLLDYDLENRLTHLTDDEGNYIEYTLNALGHRVSTKYYKTGGILVRIASATFDDLDRQAQTIGALSQATSYTYDVQGNRITATDALNRPTTIYNYDTLSRLTNIKDANVKDTAYQYDDRDQLRFVTDPIGLVTEYQYNELGQLTKLISPDTGATDYTYDLAGNRETQKDARNITVTFSYDELNRITNKTYADTALNVIYTYDAGVNSIGKLSTMQDKEGSTTYTYDERGNLTSRSRIASGQTYLTLYAYDLNDRLTGVTYPSGRLVSYVRNTLGQVTSVTTTPNGGAQQTIASNLNYLPFGALEDMDWGNGLILDQTFDTDYRLTNQVLGSSYNRAYGFDDVSNIKTITDNIVTAKSQTFNYDDLDRLDDATGNYGALNYGYDDVGNRTSLVLDANPPTNYVYNATANQLDSSTGPDAHSYTYDANGNTKTKDAYTYTYDEMNRMTQVNNGALTTSYGFNGKGERVRKAGVSTTLYHYDSSGNLLVESDAVGSTQVEYIWLGSQRLASVQGGVLYYMHTDHLGTVQLLTDGNGDVAWSGDYKPFGEVAVTTSVVTNNLRFPGQYYDVESGLYYNYFRDYDPSIGRYIESDPIGLLGGANTYVYVDSNPYFGYDLYGLRGPRNGGSSSSGFGGGGGSFGLHIIALGVNVTSAQIVTGGKVCTLTTTCFRFGPGLFIGAGTVATGGFASTSGSCGGNTSISFGVGGDIGAGPTAGGQAGIGKCGFSGSGSLPSMPGVGFGGSVGFEICGSSIDNCSCSL